MLDSMNFLYAAVAFESPQTRATIQIPQVKQRLRFHSFTMSVAQLGRALASILFMTQCIIISLQSVLFLSNITDMLSAIQPKTW